MRSTPFRSVVAIFLLSASVPAVAATLLIANKTDSTVDLFDTEPLAVKDLIKSGREPDGMASTPVRAGGS